MPAKQPLPGAMLNVMTVTGRCAFNAPATTEIYTSRDQWFVVLALTDVDCADGGGWHVFGLFLNVFSGACFDALIFQQGGVEVTYPRYP